MEKKIPVPIIIEYIKGIKGDIPKITKIVPQTSIQSLFSKFNYDTTNNVDKKAMPKLRVNKLLHKFITLTLLHRLAYVISQNNIKINSKNGGIGRI